MNDHELKALINKQPDTSPFRLGDLVRVMHRGDVEDPDMSPMYTEPMDEMHAGKVFSVINADKQSYIHLKGTRYNWHADWLERVGSHE